MKTPEESVVIDWLRSYGVCLGAPAGAGAVEQGVRGRGCWVLVARWRERSRKLRDLGWSWKELGSIILLVHDKRLLRHETFINIILV